MIRVEFAPRLSAVATAPALSARIGSAPVLQLRVERVAHLVDVDALEQEDGDALLLEQGGYLLLEAA